MESRPTTAQEYAATPSGLKVLMLSTDKNIFTEGSSVRQRMIEYGAIFDQLHVIVLSRKVHGGKQEEIAPNVWIYPTDSWTQLDYVEDVFKICKQELVINGEFVPDLISAQDPFETGVLGFLVSRKYKRKLQLQVHTDFSDPHFDEAFKSNRWRRWLARFLLPRAQCIRVVSPRMQKYIEEKYPKLRGRVDVLPIYIDVERLRTQEPAFNLHERYPQFKFIVLMVSRLVPEKNLGFALEVFSEVARRYPGAGLVIVGDGPERDMLLRKAVELSIPNQVVIEPWQNDLVAHYKTANLFLHTSHYEGYGMALLEAAVCGTAMVVSDVGIAGSLPKNKQDLFVCPVGDKSCFVKQIHAFLTDTERRLFFKLNVGEELKGLAYKDTAEYLGAYKESMERCFAISEKPS